jgi:hypothetical protein
MAGPAAATGATVLSNILGALTPRQLNSLSRHLTMSGEMQALQIIATMRANPALAPSLLPSLTSIPNLPAQVMTWVSNAITNPATFQDDMTQAQVAVQAAATNPGILGQLGL